MKPVDSLYELYVRSFLVKFSTENYVFMAISLFRTPLCE